MKRQCGADTETTFRRQPTPTLDGLLAKISAMALDLLPDNHPDVDPASLFLQITGLREAEPAAARMRRSSTAPCVICCSRQAVQWSGKATVVMRFGTGRSQCEFAVPVGIPSRHTANAILRQSGCRGVFDTSRPHLILAADLVANTTPLAPSLTAA